MNPTRCPYRCIHHARHWAVLVAVLACGLTVVHASAQTTLDFLQQTVAADAGDCKALADFDGDGDLDLAVGGSLLTIYRYPGWQPDVIGYAAVEFTTDMAAADMDLDGDPDLVVPDGKFGLYLFLNQGIAGWNRQYIGTVGDAYIHDVRAGDIDGDGDVDVVVRPLDGDVHVFRRDLFDWHVVALPTTGGEGLALHDLDGDGRRDIVVNGEWYRAPTGDIITDAWTIQIYAVDRLDTQTKVAVADLDGDERPDIALTPSEASGQISVYRAPADPLTGEWSAETVLAGADRYHSLQLADLDGDGWRDLVTAQMHTADNPPAVEAYLNPGPAGGAWALAKIADVSSHNIVVGDIDGDGRIDVAGSDFIGNPPVLAWLNRSSGPSGVGPTGPGLDLWAAPNPFRARVVLGWSAATAAPVTVSIHDVRGRLVRRFALPAPPDGSGTTVWDGRDGSGGAVGSGVYFAAIRAGDERRIRRLVLVR